MTLHNDQLVALVAATSFAAGLNIYATVATLGLMAQAEVVTLPPGLHMLASWYVIGAAALMFLLEFVADKIPGIDLVWNALHTFVRIPVAALLAWVATAQLTPGMQLMSAVLAALIAFAAHGSKLAVRAAVTPSPEPVSNTALSLGEDVLAVTLTWLASRHPLLAGAIVLLLLIIAVAITRWIIRAIRALFQGAERRLGRSEPT